MKYLLHIYLCYKFKMRMKTLLSVMFLSAFGYVSAQSSLSVVNDGLRFCESTLPYNDGILIANFGTEELNPLNSEGKGYIMYYKEGKTETFISADGYLSAPKGMLVKDNKLYVCDVNKILVYNVMNRASKPEVIRLPEGNLFVNDLVADGKYLYASVTNSDRIFRVDISGGKDYSPEEWLEVPGPNGLLINNGSMYVASYPADGKTTGKNVIYKIDNIASPKLEKFVDIAGQYDGIAASTDGKYIYITNWTPASLSKVSLSDRSVSPVNISLENPLIGPADISVKSGYIYIPDLPNSRVIVVKE